MNREQRKSTGTVRFILILHIKKKNILKLQQMGNLSLLLEQLFVVWIVEACNKPNLLDL